MSFNQHEDDSDDSLRDTSKLFTAFKPPVTISPGDIVWAKFRKLYWPALVRTVYTKEKKMSIWYTDQPGTTFKLPSKNICSFFDTQMTAKILEDVKKAGCVDKHNCFTTQAHEFLTRKGSGYKDDPMKFFYKKYDDDKSNDSVVSDDDDKSCSNVEPDYLREFFLQDRQNADTNDNNDKIVEFILSGKADLHLEMVLSKTVSSDYRDIYEEAVSRGKFYETNFPLAGPIDDQDVLRKIVFHLLKLRDSFIDKISMGKNAEDAVTKYLVKDRRGQFIYSVWLPESIIFATSETRGVSLSDARLLFKGKLKSQHYLKRCYVNLNRIDQDKLQF